MNNNKYVYRISFDFSYALADISSQKGSISSLDLLDSKPDLIKLFDYNWVTLDSNVVPNLILIMSKLLGVDVDTYKIIGHLLSDIKTIDINIADYNFVIFTSIPNIKNTLNIRKSKITKFSTGDIMYLDTPVFLPNNYPPIFKIEESIIDFFCSDLLYNIIIENNITGWKFEKCFIEAKSWF